MSTLRAGDREFHTLPAGQVLTAVAAAASAGFVRQYPMSGFDAVSATAVSAGSATTIGPFTGSVRLGVECSAGTVDWAADFPAPASDWSGSQTAAGLALVSDAGNARNAVLLVSFIDSLNQNAVYSSGTDPDGIVPPPWFVDGAVDHSWRAWGWLAHVGPISMQRMRFVKNYAVQTNGLLAAGTAPVGQPVSAQITRFLADRAAGRVKADRAVLLPGSNDTTFSLAAVTAELLAQIARLGMPVDLISPLPRGGTPTTVVGDGLEQWAWLLQFRAICKRIADASKGAVRFIDVYSKGNSPTTIPDVMQAGMTYDNTHSNNAYAFLMADAYVAATLPDSLANDLDLWPNNSNAASSGGANLIDQGVINPLMGTASGGTGTGTVAGSHTITNVGTATHVGSVIANPNGVGNLQRIAITSNANNDGVSFATASFHSQGGTFLNAGDEVYLQCLVTINSGGIYPKNLRLQFLALDNLTTNWLRKVYDIDAAKEVALPLTATRTLLLRTPSFIVPAGLTFTSVVGSLRPIFAAAGACTIDARFECRRIRAGGV